MHHFLILGGDPRQLYLSGLLEQAGQEVSLYYENPSFSLKEAMEASSSALCHFQRTNRPSMLKTSLRIWI